RQGGGAGIRCAAIDWLARRNAAEAEGFAADQRDRLRSQTGSRVSVDVAAVVSGTQALDDHSVCTYLSSMPILGHGIDIVETDRIRQLVERHGQRFIDRVFTPGEHQYCQLNPKRYYEHLAGRFAAKEAVLKVL